LLLLLLLLFVVVAVVTLIIIMIIIVIIIIIIVIPIMISFSMRLNYYIRRTISVKRYHTRLVCYLTKCIGILISSLSYFSHFTNRALRSAKKALSTRRSLPPLSLYILINCINRLHYRRRFESLVRFLQASFFNFASLRQTYSSAM
jgi:hypothetical protein